MISVWRAEPHEAEAVARLIVELRDHLGLDWPSANAFLAGVERLIEERDTAFLLAAPDDDSPPSGVAQVRFRYGLWWAADDCLLEDLFVREEARGQGVGRALVQGVIDLARERGSRRIEAHLAAGDDAGAAIFRDAGFSAEAPRPAPRTVLTRVLTG
ncbi:MAG TPA: GNAT family N-acetyltransferase [Solirubrobacteraceae bacterium]